MNLTAHICSEPVSNVETIDLFSTVDDLQTACEFVVVKNQETDEAVINLKLQSESEAVFSQCETVNEVIIVGYADRFAIFHSGAGMELVSLKFDGYFSSFRVFQDQVFVSTNSDLLCMDMTGAIKWMTRQVGLDGVVIHEISESVISGSGEWDPPGGWQPFKLDTKTGMVR